MLSRIARLSVAIVRYREVVDEFRLQLVIGNCRLVTADWRLEIGDWSGFEETAIFILVHALTERDWVQIMPKKFSHTIYQRQETGFKYFYESIRDIINNQ